MLTLLFVFALLLSVAFKLWLGERQVRHVARHRHQVPARFRDTITLPEHQKAADYTIAKSRLNAAYTIIEAVFLVGLTLLGGLQWLDDRLASWLAGSALTPLFRQLLLIGSVLLLSAMVDLPFSVFRQFRLEARFGFNRMTASLFVRDLLLSIGLGVVIGAPLILAVLALMQAAGAWWWLGSWLIFVGYSLFLSWLYPVLIAPLFNRFTPLTDVFLIERVRQLSARCGFTMRGVFVMDGSRRSAHGNAYFTGFGANKRIVFFDTLIARLSASELEAVLAHELGHFKLRHVFKRLLFSFASTLLALAILGFLSQQSWFYQDLGVDPSLATQNAMALILFLLVLPVFTFLLSPLLSGASRRHEFEADAYAAHQTDAQQLVQALVKLYQDNASTLTPDPLHSAFFDSHPPASLRIARLENAVI